MLKSSNDQQIFPKIFCIENVRCMRSPYGGHDYRALLYHDQACITVSFNTAHKEPGLTQGSFVTVDWLDAIRSDCGAVIIAGLNVQDRFTNDINPFQIIPHSWNIDRHLIEYGRFLWGSASRATRKMLLAMLNSHPEQLTTDKG